MHKNDRYTLFFFNVIYQYLPIGSILVGVLVWIFPTDCVAFSSDNNEHTNLGEAINWVWILELRHVGSMFSVLS